MNMHEELIEPILIGFASVSAVFMVLVLFYNCVKYAKKYEDEIQDFMESLNEAILKRFRLYYKEFDLMKNLNSELDNYKYDYQQDALNFIAYDTGIENLNTEPRYDDEIDEDFIYAFDDKKIIYFSGFSQNFRFVDYDTTNTYVGWHEIVEVGLLFESRFLNQRLHIATRQSYNGQEDRESYEYLYDNIELCENYDNKNIGDFSKKIINLYHGKEFKHEPYFEKLVLSEPDKRDLDALYRDTRIDFAIAIENGVGRLRIFLEKEKCEEFLKDEMESHYCDDVIKIMNRILKMFK